jgi:hypothetical protein
MAYFTDRQGEQTELVAGANATATPVAITHRASPASIERVGWWPPRKYGDGR